MTRRRVVVATGNPGKVVEIEAILADPELELVSLETFPPVAFPEEGGDYAANAIAKNVARDDLAIANAVPLVFFDCRISAREAHLERTRSQTLPPIRTERNEVHLFVTGSLRPWSPGPLRFPCRPWTDLGIARQ